MMGRLQPCISYVRRGNLETSQSKNRPSLLFKDRSTVSFRTKQHSHCQGKSFALCTVHTQRQGLSSISECCLFHYCCNPLSVSPLMAHPKFLCLYPTCWVSHRTYCCSFLSVAAIKLSEQKQLRKEQIYCC